MKTFAALPFLFLAACDAAERPRSATRLLRDSRGKDVRVPSPPRRIVSLVPSATEILFAVGAGDRVVGVTTQCDYPAAAKGKPKIGDIVVNIEKLVALRPDLVVTAYTMTRSASDDLERRGYPVFSVEPRTLEDIAAALRILGDLTGNAAKGRLAAEGFLREMRAVRPVTHGPRVYFEASGDPVWTAGADTYAGDLIRRAGGRNIFSGGWRAVDWEEVLHADPDVVLIAHDRRELLARRAGWASLKAVRSGRVRFVAKAHFVYPTPRLLEGLRLTARILHETSR